MWGLFPWFMIRGQLMKIMRRSISSVRRSTNHSSCIWISSLFNQLVSSLSPRIFKRHHLLQKVVFHLVHQRTRWTVELDLFQFHGVHVRLSQDPSMGLTSREWTWIIWRVWRRDLCGSTLTRLLSTREVDICKGRDF